MWRVPQNRSTRIGSRSRSNNTWMGYTLLPKILTNIHTYICTTHECSGHTTRHTSTHPQILFEAAERNSKRDRETEKETTKTGQESEDAAQVSKNKR